MDNIFCIECGFELPSTAKFCKKCGVEIEASESPSESKPITQTPIKTTPKVVESKAMAIGTALLEWIIIFAVAGMVGLICGILFGAKNGSWIGVVGWLIARASVRSILKSILPLRYQDETEEEEVKKDWEWTKSEAEAKADAEANAKAEADEDYTYTYNFNDDEIKKAIEEEKFDYGNDRTDKIFLIFVALIGLFTLIYVIISTN